jgi:hypothetical protein
MNDKSKAAEILDELSQDPITTLGKPASAKEIAEAEAELGLLFPQLYKEILLISGQIRLYERRMFGLGPSARRWGEYNGITVTELTQMARCEEDVQLPHHLVAVMHYSHQDYHCLDTSQTKNGDCPVVLFDTDIAATKARKPKVVAPGIIEWMRERLVAMREDKRLDEIAMAEFKQMKRSPRVKRGTSKKATPAKKSKTAKVGKASTVSKAAKSAKVGKASKVSQASKKKTRAKK